MASYTINQMRAAAENCIKNPRSRDDKITAESLLDSLNAGSTADNIEWVDEWFNKPNPRLEKFMEAYHAN